MEKYLNEIANKILKAKDTDLTLLRWLIAYHTHSFSDCISFDWVDSKREEMKAACRKCKIMDGDLEENDSDLKYAHRICQYGQSIIMKFALQETSDLSEYAVLLSIYTLIINCNSPNPFFEENFEENDFGDVLAQGIPSLCELPVAAPVGSDLKDGFLGVSVVDKLIFAFYLWVADLGVIDEYNEKICRLSTSNSYQVDADKIYDLIYRLPSKFAYFYNNPCHNIDTEKKIEKCFKEFLSIMSPEAVPFAPSIITILFNTILPTKIARAGVSDFPYEHLIREIICEEMPQKKCHKRTKRKTNFCDPKDSSFLKMLIVPEDGTFVFDKNGKNRIENRFIEYEWEHFCEIYKEIYQQAVRAEKIYYYNGWYKQEINLQKYHLRVSEKELAYYKETIETYMDKKKLRVSDLMKYGRECQEYIIKAMLNHSFTFTYVYFEMFCVLAEDKKRLLSKPKLPIDIALSMIHLNTFTKWYDAVLLHKGMEFNFLKCNNFFYLKLLSVFEEYKSFISNIASVKRQSLIAKIYEKGSKKAGEKNEKIFGQMLKLFYDRANSKINLPTLLNIFRTNSANKCEVGRFDGFHPIYQWIKLLDHTELEESYFDDIVCEKKEREKDGPNWPS